MVSHSVAWATPTLHTHHAVGTAVCAAAQSTRIAEKLLSADSSVYPTPWIKVCWFKRGTVQILGQLSQLQGQKWPPKKWQEFTIWETEVVLKDLDRKVQQRKGPSAHAVPSEAEGSCRYEQGAVQAAVQCKADFLWLAMASNLSCAPLQRIPEFNSLHWTFLLKLKSLKLFV